MLMKDFVNVTKNKANNQVSFNIKARKLKKLGINSQYLLNLKVPNDFSIKPLGLHKIKKGVNHK